VALPSQDFHIGATKCTNNTAELTAVYAALRWIALFETDPVVLEFDSEYAAGVARGVVNPRDNLSLALACRFALEQVVVAITWRKAAAHSGLVFNEHADALAACGAAGFVRGCVKDLLQLDPSHPQS
jgi:ribonuclease HI